MREPVIPVRPVDLVRPDKEEGEEQGARAGLLRGVLLLERLPLQSSAGGDALAVCWVDYIAQPTRPLSQTLVRAKANMLHAELSGVCCLLLSQLIAVT